ncbi:G patch domain-containing protein 4 [Podila minutissima]|uniref:G patch domain-containing protein 4 n=1 Tax=Podila minutissima TaxID=64525 RepID=A0A9P5SHK9_9FUNG|nr:G patch domain-containing protein 4 [Podila minutissima]
MSFAESQMAKFGWKQGEGLGKHKDGIKKSISVVKKNDTKGLGGKLDKWDFAWWDHVFNKSASNIQVNKDAESGEVKVEKQAPSDIQMGKMGIISTSRPAGPSRSAASSATASPAMSTSSTMSSMVARDEYSDDTESKPAPVAKSGPSWLFGFVKASASSAAAEEAKRTQQDFVSSADSFAARTGDYDALKQAEADEYKDYSVKVSDRDLFLACEGRTARKGARGEQPGKLGRVMTELLVDGGAELKAKIAAAKTKDASKKAKKDKKEKTEKKDKKSKKEKKDKKDKDVTEKKEKKDKKEKKEKKEGKEKKEKEKSKTNKKEKKEKKDKDAKPEKSKKRKADAEAEESQPKPAKKSKKAKSE